MQKHWCYDAVKYQYHLTGNASGASLQICCLQRTRCLRGNRAPTVRSPVACKAGEPQEPYRVDRERPAVEGASEGNGSLEWTSQPDYNADWGLSNFYRASEQFNNADLSVTGMAEEARDAQPLRSPSSSPSTYYSGYPADRKGGYECHLFDVLQGIHIDAQSASHFFSQLAMHDSWGSPLTMDELLHTARIADITGFSMPPIVLAQLQHLVRSPGTSAAKATAEPLLAVYAHDLPALLDMLQGVEVTPSIAWTDYALHAWLAVAAADGQLTAAHVHSVMTLLEAIYVPGLGPPLEPPPLSYMSKVQQQPHEVAVGWHPSPSPQPREGAVHAATLPTQGSGEGSGVAAAAAASVQAWLDACLVALLDAGALARTHQREDLYGMLAHLATAPSAAIVERLYGEAWPPFVTPGAATCPEHIAAMLWLVAASGAKLPLAIVHAELRALEAAVLRIAANGNGSGGAAAGSGGSSTYGGGGGSRVPEISGTPGDTTAAAVAALNAAFSLPPSIQARRSPHLPSSAASGSSSPGLFSPISMSFPPFGGGAPPPKGGRQGIGSRRISPYGAYLALWAFHHYHYTPHVAAGHIVGPTLLAAAVSGGAGRGLGPRQRCRVVRAVLMCFSAVPPHLLARYDWSPMFRGWETLGSAELLPLLQDAAALARQQQRRRRGNGGRATTAGGHGDQSNAGAHAQLIRLSHLAAHVVQLPGWQRRIENASFSDAVASVADLLAVLCGDGTDGGADIDVVTSEVDLGTPEIGSNVGIGTDDDDGVGGAGRSMEGGVGAVATKAILASPFAQGVLAGWLGLVLPVIQDGVKRLTGDSWGTRGRMANGASKSGPQRWDPYRQFQDSLPEHGPRSIDDGSAGGGGRHMRPANPSRPVVAANVDGNHGGAARLSASWLPPPVTAETVWARTAAPQLTAGELTAALTTLRDTAAALDPRDHPALHRTLIWALQRLGSRAGRCIVGPEAFAAVPDMLVRVGALGWVDVPLEWVNAVVQHPDAEGTWFRRLPWPEALRAVLVSGQLVQLAQSEVLCQHGGGGSAALSEAITTSEVEFHPHRDRQQQWQLSSNSVSASSWELGSDQESGLVVRPAAAAAAAPAAFGASLLPPPPTKAAALLGAAQRLRNHLVGLLAARAATCSGPELRQLALTWQVYRMPYDRDVLMATLGALTAALATCNAGTGDAAATAATRESVHNAVARLEMMCEAQQVPRDELDVLFAPLRAYGL